MSSDSDLFRCLVEEAELGVCIKNESGIVLEQSSVSLRLCGDYVGKTCPGTCAERKTGVATERAKKGRLYLMDCIEMRGELMDAVGMELPGKSVVILKPVADPVAKENYSNAAQKLSKREREIAKLLSAGFNNKDIARMMSISITTLKTHINRIYKKISSTDILMGDRPNRKRAT